MTSSPTAHVNNLPSASVPTLPVAPTVRPSRATEESTVHPMDTSSTPLLVNHNPENQPPLAGPEIDDLDDSPDLSPYPGIDDGFFDDNKPNNIPEIADRANPDAPAVPQPENKDAPSDAKPGVDSGMDEPREEVDGRPNTVDSNAGRGGIHPPQYPGFPYAPSFGHDLEFGGMLPPESIPDVNVYQHKKTLAQGMMDLALFSANANQMRYVLESFSRHPYYYPSLILISISLLLQVAVGVGLIWNATYNVKDEKEICIANKISNFTIIGIFLVTVINVFISAFGVANPPTS